MNRSDWLEWRRSGVGASDVAGILGLSPWTTPYEVWLSKLWPTDETAFDDDTLERFRWGHLLEDIITAEAAERCGLGPVTLQVALTHPDHPHHLATPDGITDPATIDAKVTADRDEWAEVPLHYYCQVQWQMHVAERDRAIVAVLHAGQRLDTHHIERDDTDIARMVEAVDQFWHVNVLERRPPVATARDLTALNRHTPATRTTIDATDELRSLVAQLADARGNAARAQEWADELQARLCQQIGDATDLVDPDTGLTLVTWRPTQPLDRDRYATDHPDVIAEHTTTVTEVDWSAIGKRLTKKQKTPYLTTGTRRFSLKELPEWDD